MSVVAKFRVNGVENRLPPSEYTGKDGQVRTGPVRLGEDGEPVESYATVKLSAIYEKDIPGADPEDLHFSKSTPQGSIEMHVSNVDALEQFQVGDTFYVRFERA